MAINTAARRLSALDAGHPSLGGLPLPAAGISGGDRLHLNGLYSGISPEGALVVNPTTATLPYLVEPFALDTIATGNERADTNPAAHVALFRYRGMTWKSDGASNLWIRGEFGLSRELDFVGLLGANASTNTRMRVRLGASQAEVDGTAPYDSGAAITFENVLGAANDDGQYHALHAMAAVGSHRWWRIDISGHSGDFEAMALVIGRRKSIGNFYNPDWQATAEDMGGIEVSPNGVPHEMTGAILRGLRVKFGWIRESEFETVWRPLDQRVGKRGMFLFVLDPTANAYRQNRTYFGWMTDVPGSQMVFFGKFEKQMDIVSIV